MKDFTDFLKQLSPETIVQMTEDAKSKSEAVTGSGQQVAAISFTIALELLGLYHQWICEES